MNRDRLVQVISIFICLVAVSLGGYLYPRLSKLSEEYSLRYTNISVDGAPPFVALGTAIGAFRGLIVDFLWIRLNLMKENGQFFELMADANLITKLQPRFPQVWAFNAHNLAYNVSVATQTLEERWEWVNAGLRMLRNEGIFHNPNDMGLYKELGFYYLHKLGGNSDDAHLYYKRRFAQEWESILGTPPPGKEDRVAWLKEIESAPGSLRTARKKSKSLDNLVRELEMEFASLIKDTDSWEPDIKLLEQVSLWTALTQTSNLVRTLVDGDSVDDIPVEYRSMLDGLRKSTSFRVLDRLLREDQYVKAWDLLLAHLRKRILKDSYNMDISVMRELTERFGPLDWRSPFAHGFYWSHLGSKVAKGRYGDEDIYRVVNTDRIQMQSLQGLSRMGRITLDPFSPELPSFFPEPLFIDSVSLLFDELYAKHWETRGSGGDTFCDFLVNFLSSSVREWYRAGEREKAQLLMDKLDKLFGSGSLNPNPFFKRPLDVFVREETQGEYESQPMLALSDVNASLRYGIRVGIGARRPEVFQDALAFAQQVTQYFKKNEYFDYTTKFGSGRIADLIGALETSLEMTLIQLMADPSVAFEQRMSIWSGIDELMPTLRARVWDRLFPLLKNQWESYPLASRIKFEKAFPDPPNLEAVRAQIILERRSKIKKEEAETYRSFERK